MLYCKVFRHAVDDALCFVLYAIADSVEWRVKASTSVLAGLSLAGLYLTLPEFKIVALASILQFWPIRDKVNSIAISGMDYALPSRFYGLPVYWLTIPWSTS